MPDELPAIVWRAGLELNPIDPPIRTLGVLLQAPDLSPSTASPADSLDVALAVAALAAPRLGARELVSDLRKPFDQTRTGATVWSQTARHRPTLIRTSATPSSPCSPSPGSSPGEIKDDHSRCRHGWCDRDRQRHQIRSRPRHLDPDHADRPERSPEMLDRALVGSSTQPVHKKTVDGTQSPLPSTTKLEQYQRFTRLSTTTSDPDDDLVINCTRVESGTRGPALPGYDANHRCGDLPDQAPAHRLSRAG